MSGSQSVLVSIAERYALALFELAQEEGQLQALEGDMSVLAESLEGNAEFLQFIRSPVASRAQKGAAIAQICKKAGIGGLMTNALALIAERGRLFILPAFLQTLSALIARAKGEVTVYVSSAVKLEAPQMKKLAKELRAVEKVGAQGGRISPDLKGGGDVKIDVEVDESLIGGLVVRFGSYMVDSSIRTKLMKLRNLMKEAG